MHKIICYISSDLFFIVINVKITKQICNNAFLFVLIVLLDRFKIQSSYSILTVKGDKSFI